MILRPQTLTRRPGLTLTEALVALFVAAIGMISLMTLFPLAAIQMSQASKDERSGQLAMIADAKMRLHWRQFRGQDPYTGYLTDPDGTGGTWSAGNNNVATGSQAGYPVFVDPLGWRAWSGTAQQQQWVAGQNTVTCGLPRRTLFQFANNPYGSAPNWLGLDEDLARSIQFCSLLDDLTYTTDGRPEPGSVERQGRFNWLAVVRLPTASVTNTADLTIVVFDARAPGYPAPNSELAIDLDQTLAANGVDRFEFIPGSTSLLVKYSGDRPPITKGRWVLDATTQSGGVDLRHANFYRVVSVNDETAGELLLELDRPVTRSTGTGNYRGTLVVLDGVAEVFRRPPLTP